MDLSVNWSNGAGASLSIEISNVNKFKSFNPTYIHEIANRDDNFAKVTVLHRKWIT